MSRATPSRLSTTRFPMRSLTSLLLATAVTLAACAPPEDAAAADAGAAAPTTARVPAAQPRARSEYSVYELGATWRDQRGDTLRLERLAGGVRLVALVYTSCHATCPLIVDDLRRIAAAATQGLPAARAGDLGIVLVSLDPARDTPGRLADWAAATRLDAARWTLLNGSDGAVRELAALLGVRYQAQPDGELAHTNVITVLDGGGRVVHQQHGLGEPAAETAAVVAGLLR